MTFLSAGWICFLLSQSLIWLALFGLWIWAEDLTWLENLNDPNLWRILRFTIWQASLSSLLSLILAIPFARALRRRRSFFGRQFLLNLASLAFVIPTMVAVIGIAIVHGHQGWMNHLFVLSGFPRQHYLYGLSGILIAHVFFNLPLATRVILQSFDRVPLQSWRIASQLGLTPLQTFRHLEWPFIRSILPGLSGIIFMLCFTSFAVVLTLGGGPRATTLEVAIYQTIRFDFDIASGVVLATIQIITCLLFYVLFRWLGKPFQVIEDNDTMQPWLARSSPLSTILDILIIALCSFILLSPLLAIGVHAINIKIIQVLQLDALWQAIFYSLIISFAAGSLAILLSLPLTFLIQQLKQSNRHLQSSLVETSSLIILITPPITLGMGLFLILRTFNNGLTYSLLVVILINALVGMPFILRILQPSVDLIAQQTDRLSTSLGLSHWQQFSTIYFPQIRTPLAYAFGIACTLAMGDMGVIALFGTQDLSTLPLLVYRLMGAYKMQEAAVVACILCLFCALIFWGTTRFSKPKNHA